MLINVFRLLCFVAQVYVFISIVILFRDRYNVENIYEFAVKDGEDEKRIKTKIIAGIFVMIALPMAEIYYWLNRKE